MGKGRQGGQDARLLGKVVWCHDVAVLWYDGRRFWADVGLHSDHCVVVARVWDRVDPLLLVKTDRQWWHLLSNEEVRRRVMSWLKRAAVKNGEEQQKWTQEHEQWAEAHPALNEYLTAAKYPDGGQRQTATVLVFVEEGVWKCCIRDRDTARTAWASAGSLLELFGTLETMLQSEDCQWRKDRPMSGPQGKKKS